MSQVNAVTAEAVRRIHEQYEASPGWLQAIERTVAKGARDAAVLGGVDALTAIYSGIYSPHLLYGAFATTAWRVFRDIIPAVVLSLKDALLAPGDNSLS